MTRVLFVCLQNAGRSQMSEALFRRTAAGTDQVRAVRDDIDRRVHDLVDHGP